MLEAVAGLAGPVVFQVGDSRFRWPLPEKSVPVACEAWDDARLDGDPTFRRAEGLPRFDLTAALPSVRPSRREEDQLFAIFLSGMSPAGELRGKTCHVLPSLSSGNGTTKNFQPRLPGSAPVAFVIGSPDSDVDERNLNLISYLSVSFDPSGLPQLACRSKDLEPFDVLGEADARQIPRVILEGCADRWQTARYQSPHRALLPAGVPFGESQRAFPACLLSQDAPRNTRSGGWLALLLAALLLLALR